MAERALALGFALATTLLLDDDTLDAALVWAWVRAGTTAAPETITTTAAIGQKARMGLPLSMSSEPMTTRRGSIAPNPHKGARGSVV